MTPRVPYLLLREHEHGVLASAGFVLRATQAESPVVATDPGALASRVREAHYLNVRLMQQTAPAGFTEPDHGTRRDWRYVDARPWQR